MCYWKQVNQSQWKFTVEMFQVRSSYWMQSVTSAGKARAGTTLLRPCQLWEHSLQSYHPWRRNGPSEHLREQSGWLGDFLNPYNTVEIHAYFTQNCAIFGRHFCASKCAHCLHRWCFRHVPSWAYRDSQGITICQQLPNYTLDRLSLDCRYNACGFDLYMPVIR